MWRNIPVWAKVARDLIGTLIGFGGAALLIIRGNPDPIVLVVLFTLAGAPGAANLSALLNGATQPDSPHGIDSQSSPLPPSESP